MIQFTIITPSQARAARAILGLALREAANRASLGINTLNKFEMDDREPPTLDTAFKVAQFYDSMGIEFPDEQTVRQRLIGQAVSQAAA